MAFIGVDIGTSGCKVCIFDINGRLLVKAGRKYQEKRGNGTREIDPVTVRTRVLEALSEASENCPEPIQSICVTCLGESLVFLDENDEPLCGSMVTGDNRGGEENEEVMQFPGSEYVFSVTGLAPSSLYSLPKLIWMKKHTDVMKKVRKIFFYEDYLGYLLTGERKVSCSSAARSQAFNIHKKEWDETLLGLADLKGTLFSQPVDSGDVIGYVKEDIAAACHVPAGIPVIAGAHDQVCAALGGGMVASSTAEDGIGTCECLALILPDTPYDQSVLSRLDMPLMIYPLRDSFFTTLEVTTCGALMNWIRDVLLRGVRQDCEKNGVDFFRYMDEQVAGKQTDVLLLPQFGSSGHPDLNLDHMAGAVCGMTLDTTEADLFLAAKEAMVYQIRLAHEVAAAEGLRLDYDKIVLTGGAAGSAVTAQIRADIMGRPVYTLANNEAGALGCMILSATALGFYPDISACVNHVVSFDGEFLPNPEAQKLHEEKYQKFKEFYTRMHIL